MRRIFPAMMVLLAAISGCEPTAPNAPSSPPPKSDVEIKAPGVDIKIDKEKDGGADVEVKAPGADVKVD